ncbi:MAG: hypothetical protein DMG76_29120, partial [Acidobacteria bacterium]
MSLPDDSRLDSFNRETAPRLRKQGAKEKLRFRESLPRKLRTAGEAIRPKWRGQRGGKLDNLRWEDSTIGITQGKTGAALTLRLTNGVGEALIDYLKSGHPQTTHREVFLKVNPPFGPFRENNNLYDIVTYWRRLAGITFRSPQKQGLHSLRHTLATRLLEKGTPFTTIAEILGHTSLESTRI